LREYRLAANGSSNWEGIIRLYFSKWSDEELRDALSFSSLLWESAFESN
jgi:hypothetical protein